MVMRNYNIICMSLGFIDFIVDPSMAVCADMLELILTPAPPATTTNTQPLQGATESGNNSKKFVLSNNSYK